MKQLHSKKGAISRLRSVLFLFVLLFAGVAAYAQSRQITGVVSDANGPMPGVAVSVTNASGAGSGTVTDAQGRYTIQAAPGSTLSFSFLGYTTQAVTLGQQTRYDVTLEEDAVALDQVVAIGYGTARKRDLTGSVFSVKTEDIAVAPTSNVMEALQGRISGMDITKSSGQIGSDVSILLRGSRSIYGDNSPLFIIDGIPGSYSAINPSDIESVDVLKDASSTAIYGSAGSNGVVIITTKKGKEGKAAINFDAYYGFSGEPKYFHGMIGDEWTAYQREAYKYKNGQYPVSMADILSPAVIDLYGGGTNAKWIDWVEEASGRTAITQRYNFSVSAGSQNTKIYASLNYEANEGLLHNEDLNRYAARLSLDQTLFPWATFGISTNLSYEIRNRGVQNTFTKSLTAFPLGDVRDAEGNIIYQYAGPDAKDVYTPLGDLIPNQFLNNNRNTNINTNAFLEIKPGKDLTFRTTIYADLTATRLGEYWGGQTTANRPTYASTPHAQITNRYNYGYTWENMISYNKTFAEDHNLAVTLVSSWNKSEREHNMPSGSGQTLDSWSVWRLLSATGKYIDSSYSRTQKMAYIGRLNYSYKGKYLFSASLREDGVSHLAQGNKWDFFPAVSAGWRISDEPFMEPTQGWLSNLKLRAGWGVTGNSGGISAYQSETNAYAYSSAGITVDGKIVPFDQYTGYFENRDLGWEKTSGVNIGIDAALFKNRIDLSLDLFSNTTKDLLFKRGLPPTTGLTGWGAALSRWENLAETSGKGIELTVNSRNIVGKDFNWNTTLTLTSSRDRIEALPTGNIIGEKLFVGQPLKVEYGYKYLGIWSTEEANAPENSKYEVKPGWVKIQTIPSGNDEGKHKYGDNDRQILGQSNPKLVAGLNNTFTYKGIDLSFFAMARWGHTISSGMLGRYSAAANASSGLNNNQIAGVDYWTEENQDAFFPVPGSGGDQSRGMSALRVRNGSFIKIKNITLGYTLPRAISQKVLMQRARVYATMYNPLIYVKDKQLRGTDPEMGGSDAFPLYKQFVFGVNITF
jgi:TonB-linked SusC/RagA family outer membrane protein